MTERKNVSATAQLLRPSLAATGLITAAEQHPDRQAIHDPSGSMTFGEMEAAVDALACRLVETHDPRTATPGWLPIVVDRSTRSAIAILAAIRAGRPFTPIESTLPTRRIAELLASLGHPPEAVVTDPTYASLLPHGMRVIPVFGAATGHVEPVAVDMTSPGLVVFTSGSTGSPKGVVRAWGAFDRSVQSQVDRQSARGAGVWRRAQLRPFGFVAGVSSTLSTATGQSIHICDPSSMGPDALLDWIDAGQLDEVSFGSTLIGIVLAAAKGARRIESVTTIRNSGEALSWEHIEPLRGLASRQLTVDNAFGASESGSVFRYSIGPDDPIGVGRVPLGRQTATRRVRLEPVGEDISVTQLVVAEPYALRYLDPELTARRFFTDADGVRWWRSGDIVTVDDDGLYHHRGRIDDMVKINGMLVEPSEAEEALRAIDGISSAAVLPHRTESGRTRLVAHVSVDDQALTLQQVRSQLDERLPKHLVPAMLVRHDALPFNERGKLDRAALLSNPLERWHETPQGTERSEMATFLCGLLAEILELGAVNPDEDIWEIGLDSLGAVELCAALSDAGFGQIEPTLLLDVRTPLALEDHLGSAVPSRQSPAVEFNSEGSRPPLFAIPGGGGTALAFRPMAAHLGADQPLVVIEPQGLHTPGRADTTIAAQAERARREIERRLVGRGSCVILGYSAGGTVAYEVAQQLQRLDHHVHLVLLDAAPGSSSPQARGAERIVQSAGTTMSKVRMVVRSPSGVASKLRRIWSALVLRFDFYVLRYRPTMLRNRTQKYFIFAWIAGKANSRYIPTVATFPVTLLQVDDGHAEHRCRPLIPQLHVEQVAGDHHSMLAPPHVARLADLVAAVAASVYAC